MSLVLSTSLPSLCQAEAMVLAIAGGSDLLQRTQQIFFQKDQSSSVRVSALCVCVSVCLNVCLLSVYPLYEKPWVFVVSVEQQ